jgi:hypothetical protein
MPWFVQRDFVHMFWESENLVKVGRVKVASREEGDRSQTEAKDRRISVLWISAAYPTVLTTSNARDQGSNV